MPQSSTVARGLRLVTESTGVPFCQCLTASRSVQLRGTARAALGGTGRRHVGEDAAANGDGAADSEAKDERGAARLAIVEGGYQIVHQEKGKLNK